MWEKGTMVGQIKCVFFDLDGVLFDGKAWHEEAFLGALQEVHPIAGINQDYHHVYLDGLSTLQKLDHLREKFGLEEKYYDAIFQLKQKHTERLLVERLAPNKQLQHMLQMLRGRGLRLLCVSNSIYRTVQIALSKLGILYFFDGILSNEDARNPKPACELYLRAFLREKISPYEALIVEDSYYGRCAAFNSGAHVLPVVDTTDNTLAKIEYALDAIPRGLAVEPRCVRVHVVIPMAGHGSRFVKAGYKDPKPFIPVLGKPMIQHVVENMMVEKQRYGFVDLDVVVKPVFHFVAQEEHLQHYSLGEICDKLGVEYTINTVSKVTEGSACTILLAAEHYNNDEPMVSVNSDQWLDWDAAEFYRALLNPSYDGAISVFHQTDLSDIKWSYSALHDSAPYVRAVAEKEVISCWATTGVYGWKRGSDYVKYAQAMIDKNIRVNGEFYTCPVYNEAVGDGKKIRNVLCRRLWGLGVPEDLQVFLRAHGG